MIDVQIFKDTKGIEPFTEWFDSLKDKMAKVKIRQRLDRMKFGNYGDVEPVGQGISETKIDYGPGYRIYFATPNLKMALILYGGDKKTQKKDIKKSHEYYNIYKSEKK